MLAFHVEAWQSTSVELQHGRNLPIDAWFGTASGSITARFSPEFWQAAPQSASPTKHVYTNRAANLAKNWADVDFVTRLGAKGWRGPIAPRALLERLLLVKGVRIGDYGKDAALLSKQSTTFWFSGDLTISVYHEQFEDDPEKSMPIGRFPLLSVSPTSANAGTPMIFFSSEYDHFSVDLQWFAPSGLPTLRLERLFVKIV